MRKFRTKMMCSLLSLVMLVSLINLPVAFADNTLVMQIGSNGSSVVDKVSSASVVKTGNVSGVAGSLVHGKLENSYQTPYINMTKQGNRAIDVDNDILNNIYDATFEVWVDNNYCDGIYRYRRYLLGLFDEATGKEMLSIKLCNGTTTDSLGYGFYCAGPGGKYEHKTRGTDNTIFDEWAHIVVAIDTTDDGQYTEYHCYLNGVRMGGNKFENTKNEDGTYTNLLKSDDMRLRIGHSTLAGSNDKWFGTVGRLGDLKVYNYAMAASQISSLYNADKEKYINDLSTWFSIEKKETNTTVQDTDNIQACATGDKGAYVESPYAAGGTVKVNFTSPINRNSVSEDTINLVDINGNVVPGSTSVEVSDMGYVAYITYGQLTEGAQYAVKLNGLKSVNNVVLTDATSQYVTFTGGTAENGILFVRPFEGNKLEYTLNFPLTSAEFEENIMSVPENTSFSIADALYDEATRTITLIAQEKLIAGNEYTVGYAGMTKTFTAVAAGEVVIEVPVAPEEAEPQIPAAPVEPQGSLLMNISVVGGEIVDTTGNGTVKTAIVPGVGGTIVKDYIANKKQTPYVKFTQNGAGIVEVDSAAIEGVDNMTFDVWVKNDDRNIDTSDEQRDRYNNTLFTIADPTVTGNVDPSLFHVGLNDGTSYAEMGYGIMGNAKVAGNKTLNMYFCKTTQSDMWDEWTHVVITKEKPATGDNYTVKYYIDGEKVMTSYAGHTYTDSTTNEKIVDDTLKWTDTVLRIGHVDSTAEYAASKWRGLIGAFSEFKAFNYVKTDAEIKQQYEAQKYNYIEDLSDEFKLELVEASKETLLDYPRGPYAAGGKIKATFSAPVDKDTINENTLNLVDASGKIIPGSVEVELSEQGTVAYITYGEVAVGSEYYLKVNGLQSVNGIPLTVTSSEPVVFIDGGTAEKDILLVRPFVGKKIEVTLNYPLKASEFDASKAVLGAGGYDYPNTTATYNEATRTISLTNDVDFVQRGKYLFTYDGMSKNFIAEEYVIDPISIGTPVFMDQAGNVITTNTVSGVTSICSDVNVVTDGTKEFVAILSVYCDGVLVDVDTIGTTNSGFVNKFTNEVTELNSALTYTFDLEVNSLDEGEEYTSKLMLWDPMNNMAPYAMYTPSGN